METIIQSTNYADFLAITLAENVKVLDDITVYTKTGDEATKKVCFDLKVKCIETDNFTKDGSKFNRGAVYNESFKNLKNKGWVLVLDSDILLPSDFNKKMANTPINREYFYGARRYNIETWEDWLEIGRGKPLSDFTLFRGFGYGYLQLFHADSYIFKSLGQDPYPEHGDGSEADWRFRNCWGDIVWKPDFDLKGHQEENVQDYGSHYLRCLPFHVTHLGVTGINATGRHTPLWK